MRYIIAILFCAMAWGQVGINRSYDHELERDYLTISNSPNPEQNGRFYIVDTDILSPPLRVDPQNRLFSQRFNGRWLRTHPRPEYGLTEINISDVGGLRQFYDDFGRNCRVELNLPNNFAVASQTSSTLSLVRNYTEGSGTHNIDLEAFDSIPHGNVGPQSYVRGTEYSMLNGERTSERSIGLYWSSGSNYHNICTTSTPYPLIYRATTHGLSSDWTVSLQEGSLPRSLVFDFQNIHFAYYVNENYPGFTVRADLDATSNAYTLEERVEGGYTFQTIYQSGSQIDIDFENTGTSIDIILRGRTYTSQSENKGVRFGVGQVSVLYYDTERSCWSNSHGLGPGNYNIRSTDSHLYYDTIVYVNGGTFIEHYELILNTNGTITYIHTAHDETITTTTLTEDTTPDFVCERN